MPTILLASDLDKTLLNDQAEVPGPCLEAIRSFTSQGGLFTVDTGRPTRGVLIYPDLIELVNAPIITYNGACIYDTKTHRTIWRQLLPDTVKALIPSILERFPNVGILVFRGEDDFTCAVRENDFTREITWVRERYEAPVQTLEEIPLPWNKAVASGPPEEIAACAAYVKEQTRGAVTTILSEGIFLEIIGPGVGKDRGLCRVADMMGVERSCVVAIGDSMNDIHMIRWAGTGVAVENAEAAVRQAADLIVASNAEYGVRQCIEQIALPLLSKN